MKTATAFAVLTLLASGTLAAPLHHPHPRAISAHPSTSIKASPHDHQLPTSSVGHAKSTQTPPAKASTRHSAEEVMATASASTKTKSGEGKTAIFLQSGGKGDKQHAGVGAGAGSKDQSHPAHSSARAGAGLKHDSQAKEHNAPATHPGGKGALGEHATTNPVSQPSSASEHTADHLEHKVEDPHASQQHSARAHAPHSLSDVAELLTKLKSTIHTNPEMYQHHMRDLVDGLGSASTVAPVETATEPVLSSVTGHNGVVGGTVRSIAHSHTGGSPVGSTGLLDPIATSGQGAGSLVQAASGSVLGAAAPIAGDMQSTGTSGVGSITGVTSGSTLNPLASSLTSSTSSPLNPVGGGTVDTAGKNVDSDVSSATSTLPAEVPVSTSTSSQHGHGLGGSFSTGPTGKTIKSADTLLASAQTTTGQGGTTAYAKQVLDHTAGKALNQNQNQETPVDGVAAQTLPTGNKEHASLVSVQQKNVSASVLQTPGKADTIADNDTDSLTSLAGEMDEDHDRDVHVKVNKPQQGSGDGVFVAKGGKLGPDDQYGNVLEQVQDGSARKHLTSSFTASSTASHPRITLSLPLSQVIPHTSSASHHPLASASASPLPHTSALLDGAVLAEHLSTSSSSHSVGTHTHTHTPTHTHARTPLVQATVKPLHAFSFSAPAHSAYSAVNSVLALEHESAVASATSSLVRPAGSAVAQAAKAGGVGVHHDVVQVDGTHTDSLAQLNAVRLPLPPSPPSPSASTSGGVLKMPTQARVPFGKKAASIVACDGNLHSSLDVVDECIAEPLLGTRPKGTEVCPEDMQRDIHYTSEGIVDPLTQQVTQEVIKYVRLCVEAAQV